jgi:hypothetical protein
MALHEGRFYGGVAMIVLGGMSGKDWERLRDELKPDVMIGANGANRIKGLDYWLCTENLTRASRDAERGDKHSMRYMDVFKAPNDAGTKLINWKSLPLVDDREKYIAVRIHRDHPGFSFRKYGEGLLVGWVLQHTEAGATVHVGTVGLHSIHLAALLGVREIHTIGFDLCFKDDQHHHWYEYPKYRVDRYRTPQAFVQYKGLATQWQWIEAGEYLKTLLPKMKAEGIRWVDHSDGLLQAMKVAR